MAGAWNGGISRRKVLKAGAGAASLAALASLGASRAAAQSTPVPSNFDWQQFKGEEITTLMVLSPRTDLLKQYQQEFEDLTGIKVSMDVVPEQQQRQKQVIEFTSGNPSFDVTSVSWHVQKGLFGKGHWLLDLRDMLNDPKLTSPDYDIEDFSKASMTFATQSDGRIDTLPQDIDYWILYWNKELFQQAGIEFPKTLDEVVAAAKALTNKDKNTFGWVSRGLKNANTPVWTSFMQGWEVPPVDDQNKLHTTDPAAIDAAKYYQDLMANYAPPGSSGFNWNECQTTFSQGTAAMWFDGIGFAPPLEDPSKSKVVGKVGYGLQPAGPVARHSGMFGDGLGISAKTKKQGPAYLYCQWATNKKNQARMLAAGAGSPARESAYSDPEALANLKVPQEWVDTLIASGKIGLPSLPQIIPVTEFRDVFGIALTNMITGADPQKELEKATRDLEPVLEKIPKEITGWCAPAQTGAHRLAALPTTRREPRYVQGSRAKPNAPVATGRSFGRRGFYIRFIIPAILVIFAVIIFPWAYTVFMSLHDWQVGSARVFIGLDNYTSLLHDDRFREAVSRTFVYTLLAVIFPVTLGIIAAVIFHQEMPLRGLVRTIFIMPMMATPVAIALVWTMMFHPQLGVLNYLLSSIGLPTSLWVYSPNTVIPSLVLVETWQWTPLVMLIVLGGLAAMPTDPLESAVIDGAGPFQIFKDITLPMIFPFIMVAVVLRTIDALKSFDIIFAITQGGPGTASETINIYLYLQAFSFFQIGHASAVVVVFFAIIVACSLVLLYVRQRARWT